MRKNTYEPSLPSHPHRGPPISPAPLKSPTTAVAQSSEVPARSFRVKRPNAYVPPPSSYTGTAPLDMTVPAPASPTFGTGLNATAAGPSQPTTGYNTAYPSPPKTPSPPVPMPSGGQSTGYSPSAFVPIHNSPSPPMPTPPSPSAQNRAAIEEKRWSYPHRPAKDPRRSSEEIRR